jgi:pimeloyl-ACP methyl ester carboxylesterase
MWESLATTQRQDRVLHGAAKLLNLIAGLVLLPIWLIGQRLRDPLQGLLARLDTDPRPLPVPPPRERSMDALMAELGRLPSRLAHSRWGDVRKGLADVSSFVLAQHREAANLGYAYPHQFVEQVFEGADGETIAATVALHETPRPGLVLAHGLFSSRRFDYVRQIAVRAYYEWGFNVAALDLRSFGLTNLTTRAPSTVGWKEGEDVIACARYLKGHGATSVGALGISLGGSAVLGAAHPEEATEAVDGGILAISPPADPRAMAERLTLKTRRRRRDPAWLSFRAMLTSRVREARWPLDTEGFRDPVERVFAPFYEVSPDELWSRAAAVNHIARARVPVLVLHPEDDWLIPVREARRLAEAAGGNDLVRVWILPGGSHGAIDAVDRDWAYAVYRGFFERWARYAERDGAPAAAGPRELVYSPTSAGQS